MTAIQIIAGEGRKQKSLASRATANPTAIADISQWESEQTFAPPTLTTNEIGKAASTGTPDRASSACGETFETKRGV
jgi:hypothetical protein